MCSGTWAWQHRLRYTLILNFHQQSSTEVVCQHNSLEALDKRETVGKGNGYR